MEEPTLDQLVNFISVRITSEMGMAPSKNVIRLMLEAQPGLQDSWRERHREFQEAIDRLCKHCGGEGTVATSRGQASCLRCGGSGQEEPR